LYPHAPHAPPPPPPPPRPPSFADCWSKTTSYNSHGGVNYLDRHDMDCGSSAYIRGFRLQRSGSSIRYSYTCCSARGESSNNERTALTGWNANNGMVYLDRHDVDCGGYEAFSRIKLEASGSSIRYRYECSSPRASACPSSKYHAGTTSTSCYSCPSAKYQSSNAKSSCIGCPSGKYQSQHTKTSCYVCPSGKYQSQSTRTSCIRCTGGKFQNR
jgi:hypothetical protein